MTISIIHPSRSRPLKSASTIKSWVENISAKNTIEIIHSVDTDDEFLGDYKHEISKIKWNSFVNHDFVISENKNAVQAINAAAKVANGDILIVVSDDTECFKDWDNTIVELAEGKQDWIMKFEDGTQPWIITMPVMDRVYYSRFGYIYHPSYQHMYCDTELTVVADMLGKKIKSYIMFYHNYHSICSVDVAPDKLKLRNDSTFENGRLNFIARKARNFDLPAEYKMPVNFYTEMK
jgi:TusA-related sulfurtransferase